MQELQLSNFAIKIQDNDDSQTRKIAYTTIETEVDKRLDKLLNILTKCLLSEAVSDLITANQDDKALKKMA